MDLISIIHSYGYPVFFGLAVVEGPIATVIASFLASVGFFNIFIVLIISIIGDLIGDLIYYSIGFFGKRKFLNSEKFMMFSAEKVVKLQEHFENHGGKTLLLGKLTHGVGFTVLIASGVAEMSLSRFMLFTLLGTIPKCLFFVALGFYFGEAYGKIDNYLSYLGFLVAAAAIIIAIYFLLKKIVGEKFKYL